MNHLVKSLSNVSLRSNNKLYIPRLVSNCGSRTIITSNSRLFNNNNNSSNNNNNSNNSNNSINNNKYIRHNTTTNIFSQALKSTKDIEANQEKKVKVDINNNDETVTIQFKHIRYSQWKLTALFRAIRGLNYKEAVAQLSFCPKGPSKIIRGLIKHAVHVAETKKNMDPERIIVNQIWLGPTSTMKRLNPQGRGHYGIIRMQGCHITVQVKEAPFVEGEKKVGKFGKKHVTYQKYNGTYIKPQ